MDVFFGMGVPGANPNDPSFFLRLPHLWPIFVIPIVCFYAFLAVWVVRKVREAMAAESHASGAGPSTGSTNIAGPSGTIRMDDKALQPEDDDSPLNLRFSAA
jgi:hypothetical protein